MTDVVTQTNGSAPGRTGGETMRTNDSLENLVSGLGTVKDKRIHASYVYAPLQQPQLEAAFRQDWIARKIVRCPAQDATREWRDWKADDGQIEDIEALEMRLRIQNKTRQAVTLARLLGGSVMFLGVGNDDPTKELIVENVKKDTLRYAHVVGRYEVSGGDLITDVTSEFYGQHSYYEVQSASGPLRVHPSRVIRFLGEEVPDLVKNQGWGDSCLQSVDDAVKDAGLCSGGIASLVAEAKVDVFKIPGLMDSVGDPAWRALLIERMTLANVAKSMVNALLMDKEEEWERIKQEFGGLPDVLKVYLLVASGAADIPATRLLGQSPTGLTATGESDVRNYYDRISAEQKNDLSPAIERLDEIIIRSALGQRDEDIYYDWRPLWQQSPGEKADVALKKAQTFKIHLDSSLLPDEAMANALVNQLTEDGTYPGLEKEIEAAGGIDLEERNAEIQAQAALQQQTMKAAANQNEEPEIPKKTGTDDSITHYDPTQKRVAPGNTGGGQWTKEDVVNKPIKGTSVERVAMRKALKEAEAKGEGERASLLRKKVMESFLKQREAALKSGDLAKAAELAGKIGSYSKKYGVPNPIAAIKTIGEANKGYTPAEIAAGKEAAAASPGGKTLTAVDPATGNTTLTHTGPDTGVQKTAQFTPEEMKGFNDLAKMTGSGPAKGYSLHAKEIISKGHAPAGMSVPDIAHVAAYTGSYYGSTNRALRAGVMDEAIWTHVNSLNAALDKMPNHVGTVYRKADLSAEVASLYRPGMIVEERAFTSSSKNSGEWGGNHRYEISSLTGKDVSRMAIHPSEQEVLFRSGTRFRVISKTGNVIRMEEVNGR